MMRVGVVTTSYPRFPGDSAGAFVAEHVQMLRANGATIDVISARKNERLFSSGGAPDALERPSIATIVDAARFSAWMAATVARRGRRWDAVVAHWLAPSALAALPARGPLLAIAHGGDVHLLIRIGLLAPALALLAARRARVVAVSRDLLDRMIAAAPRPLARWLERDAIVQSMGIDVARFAALPQATTPPTIAVIARLVAIKGIDVAIDAMSMLARRDARLEIAGDGPLATSLADRARDKPIDLLGALDGAARDRLLARASVVVVPSRPTPSRVEGMPVVALEALAAGRPVVASATGGLRELPAPARLVPPDDAPALAAAIDAALADPPAPETCRRSIADRDWSIVGRRLSDHWFS
jgi:glycosyltransferase involved in cell wall biosynthesis